MINIIKNSFKCLPLIILFFFKTTIVSAETIKEIKVIGNDRISEETILMFSDINVGDDIKNFDINLILKRLYESNFFNDVSVDFTNGIITIKIFEAPLIQNIIISGVKAQKYRDLINENRFLKPKSSFNDILLSKDIELIKSKFKSLGFFFTEVDTIIEELDNNIVDIEFKINIGEKSKISKISFIGDKIYKNKKLKSIIISEEFKFWKFISGKKYLQEQLINLDTRLLKNFYLNNGFYNVKVNSSFAKLIDDNEFELIFNINPGEKIFFNDFKLILPNDFDKINYKNLDKLFKSLKDEPYSINSVEKILYEIDQITISEEFKSIRASLEESIDNNKLDINFIIEETDKFL